MTPPEDSYLEETTEDRERESVRPTCMHAPFVYEICPWCGELLRESDSGLS